MSQVSSVSSVERSVSGEIENPIWFQFVSH